MARHYYFQISLFLTLSLLLAIASSAEKNNFPKYQAYARFANAAYLNKNELYKTIEQNGWVIDQYDTIPDIEVRYFIATNQAQQRQIISVRGTANIENALVDAAHKLILDKSLNIKLHEGFALAAKAITKAVLPRLNRDFRLSTTGHSLGGGVAVIIAMHLINNNYPINEVITFGQPKVTNLTGALKYQHLNLTRIVTPKDLVPLVPPFDAMDVNNLDIYWHLGTEIILLPGLEYAKISGLKSMLRATDILGEKISKHNLENHRMKLYLDLINEKHRNATEVEYKNTFNLFKLF
ncbi:MAG TPA: lipase family protein [Gammaproteobacteria bacterium]|nr:lipase family protein [Gammaproteobacteria bacterium]